MTYKRMSNLHALQQLVRMKSLVLPQDRRRPLDRIRQFRRGGYIKCSWGEETEARHRREEPCVSMPFRRHSSSFLPGGDTRTLYIALGSCETEKQRADGENNESMREIWTCRNSQCCDC